MKFRWKVTVCTVCLLSVLFGAGSTLLLSYSFQNALEQEVEAAKESYSSILGTMQMAEELGALQNNGQLAALFSQLSPQKAAGWAALELTTGTLGSDEERKVLLRSGNAVEQIEDAAIADEGENVISYFSTPEGRNYLQISGCFWVDEQKNVLTVSYDISSVYDMRKSQLRAYYGIFTGLLCVGAVVSYLISFGLTRPLTKLSDATRAISGGDFSSRVHINGADEIGAVGKGFDQMAEKLEENVLQLRRAMEQQERFIGSFTHELKTPMTAIIGYADLMRQQILTAEEQQDAANYIFSEARRLEKLSIRLLNIQLGKHTKAELVPVCLSALLQEIKKYQGIALEKKGVTLSVSCEEGVCLLEGDLVKSLLLNLIDNACKAMPEGGEIQIVGQLTDTGCILTVKDTGYGIPPDAIAHLTEAFYRVDKARSRAQGGAGLGLTLCAQIAQLHHGSIRFESAPEQGTSVIVALKGGRA